MKSWRREQSQAFKYFIDKKSSLACAREPWPHMFLEPTTQKVNLANLPQGQREIVTAEKASSLRETRDFQWVSKSEGNKRQIDSLAWPSEPWSWTWHQLLGRSLTYTFSATDLTAVKTVFWWPQPTKTNVWETAGRRLLNFIFSEHYGQHKALLIEDS